VSSDRFVQGYIAELGLVGIFVVATAGGNQVKIGASSDVPKALKRLAADRAGAKVAAVRWCAREARAKTIAQQARARFKRLADDDGWHAVGLKLNGRLATDKDLQSRAEVAKRAVDQHIKRLRAAGEFRALTRRYKAERLERSAAGQAVRPWSAWLADFKIGMLRAAAAIGSETRREIVVEAAVAATNVAEIMSVTAAHTLRYRGGD
jgi:hypothetical protein